MRYWKVNHRKGQVALLFLGLFWLQAAGDTLTTIRAIGGASKEELPVLWKKHSGSDGFRFLLIKRWMKVAPDQFLERNLTMQDWGFAARSLGWHEAESGAPLNESVVVRRQVTDLFVTHYFKAFARRSPLAAENLWEGHGEKFNQSESFLRSSILEGLALVDPSAAFAMAEERSPFRWKSLSNGGIDYDWRTGSSRTLYRWLVFCPEEAFACLKKEDELLLATELVAILSLHFPKRLETLLKNCPTGTKKRGIEEALAHAAKHSKELKKFYTCTPPDEFWAMANFEAFVELASICAPDQFHGWLTDERLNHLWPEEIKLVRSLIEERRAAIDLKEAEQGEASEKGIPADGKLTLKVPSRVEDDREGFLALALENPEKKDEMLKVLGSAWIRKDFDWTVKVLSENGCDPFTVIEDFSLSQFIDWGGAPFDYLHRMPKAWKKSLLISRQLYSRDPVRWLGAEHHPGLMDAELRAVQKQIGREAHLLGIEHTRGIQRVVEEAHWLSEETKGELAAWIVARARWYIDLKSWAMTLPPAIRLEVFKLEKELESDQKRNHEVLGDRTIAGFLTTFETGYDPVFSNWTRPQIDDLLKAIREMKPEGSGKLGDDTSVIEYPLEVRLALIPKILADPELVVNVVNRALLRETTKEAAERRPAFAAKWAEKLADESLQAYALGFVADRWREQDEMEAIEWIKTLPEPLQVRLGVNKR